MSMLPLSNDSSYTITLKYTLYDHFGLDANDVSTYYFVDSFAAWYILQHYNRFVGLYKPFLTLMTQERTVIVEK